MPGASAPTPRAARPRKVLGFAATVAASAALALSAVTTALGPLGVWDWRGSSANAALSDADAVAAASAVFDTDADSDDDDDDDDDAPLLAAGLPHGSTSPLLALTSGDAESRRAAARTYRRMLLPLPQAAIAPGKPLQYQRHNCAFGRQGSMMGLANAGFSRVPEQWSFAGDKLSRVFPDASVIVSCNAREATQRLMRESDAKTRIVASLVGVFGDAFSLGSGKDEQLLGRREFAARHGCDYDELRVQPPQFIVRDRRDCTRLFDEGESRPRTMWVIKPSDGARGRGIELFRNAASLQRATG